MEYFYILLCILVICYSHANPNLDPKYAAICTFSLDLSNSFRQDCYISTFNTRKDFELHGHLSFLNTELCTIDGEEIHNRVGEDAIAVVNRGQCPIQTKCLNSKILGYVATVVVNTDLETFPPGSSSDEIFEEPCVVVGSSFYSNIKNICLNKKSEECSKVFTNLKFGEDSKT